jgi:hypothetical protein
MELSRLAVPSVSLLITFLGYTSQWVLLRLEKPEPPTTTQLIRFNALLLCLWICYYRAVTVDPGHIPESTVQEKERSTATPGQPRKWCRKCDAAKPPRAHQYVVRWKRQSYKANRSLAARNASDAYRKWIIMYVKHFIVVFHARLCAAWIVDRYVPKCAASKSCPI